MPIRSLTGFCNVKKPIDASMHPTPNHRDKDNMENSLNIFCTRYMLNIQEVKVACLASTLGLAIAHMNQKHHDMA